MSSRTLMLNLKSEYFNQIKVGEKTEEYRLCTPYWQKRIEGRVYDAVCICLGYPKKNDTERRILFPWSGYEKKTITHKLFGDKPVKVYAIKLKMEW